METLMLQLRMRTSQHFYSRGLRKIFAKPLTLFWSKSFDTGYIPEELKAQ